jgi:hypothetical protein
LNENIDPL